MSIGEAIMTHSFWQLYIHAVWCTKNRSNILHGRLEIVAHDAIRSAICDLGMVPICVNSAWNHTHCLVSWNPSVSVEDALQSFKDRAASKWATIRSQEKHAVPKLIWQRGWGAFSVSPGKVEHAKSYIVNQKSLHRSGDTIKRYESLKGEMN